MFMLCFLPEGWTIWILLIIITIKSKCKDYIHNQKKEDMKVTKETAKANRAAVVQAAGRVMRQSGISNAPMGDIAQKAGLTHGAIYRHFPNKAGLAAAAIAHDFDTISDLLAQDGMTYARYVQTYLSAQHRDHFPWGCPAGALAGEIARQGTEVQAAFTAGLHRNIAALAALIPHPDAQAKATATLALMVGALSMARAVAASDMHLSDAILQSASAMALIQG
jgi:TetR/AcrR family transcriptional repressor of nem operon